jgi:Putative zinc-binding metallo-peptidase
MSERHIRSLVHGWETVRLELLNTKISDLGLRLEGSPVERFTRRLLRELESRRIRFRPEFYLTDVWGCPDKVPVIGIPFYLADPRLIRLEEEQAGEVEDGREIMTFLRHEAGHAVNYAYRLWRKPGWRETFGAFSRPYPMTFRPDRVSRAFVRHLDTSTYGRMYAQRHPDEDFAETFAVWLTPRGGWRGRYRLWPALRKLKYVDALMKGIRDETPRGRLGSLSRPVATMNLRLIRYYGLRAERYRKVAQGYVDDRLRQVFPPVRGKAPAPAADFLREHRRDLLALVVRWAGLDEEEAGTILDKLEHRARALGFGFPRVRRSRKLMEIAGLATALAMDYAYTGRLTG